MIRLVGGVVGRIGDSELERRFGASLIQRVVFSVMARSFTPQAAEGFHGMVVIELTRPATDGPPSWWTLEVTDAGARAIPGAPGSDDSPEVEPALRVQVPVADFMRIAAGVIDPAEPLLTGRATVRGDLGVAARMAEMFGAPRPR